MFPAETYQFLGAEMSNPTRSTMHGVVAAAVALLALLWISLLGVAGQSTEPVRVSTAEELQDAIDNGETNVILTEHLDMRGIQPSTSAGTSQNKILLYVRGNTKYIQVSSDLLR